MTVNSVALVAHDHKKPELAEWVAQNKAHLDGMEVYATGTTGRIISETLGRDVHALLSGPLGGDQQIGAKIAEGEIDMLVFFWDPLQPMPHDPDIKALLRIAALWDVPVACNRASADYLIRSPLIKEEYAVSRPDFSAYTNRKVLWT